MRIRLLWWGEIRPLRWDTHSADFAGRRLAYGDEDQTVNIIFSANGEWRDLLNDETAVIHNYRLNRQRIPSNWGRIFHRQN